MKIALNTLVLKNYNSKEAVLAALGLQGIEINGRHLPPDTTLETAKTLLEGQIVVGIGAYTGGFTQGKQSDILNELEKYVDLAHGVGAKGIRIHPGGPGSKAASLEEYQRAVAGLKEAAKIADPIELYLELHHNDLADSPRSVIRLIEDVGASNIGVILDPANMYIQALCEKEEPHRYYLEEAITILKDRLSLVHMKDIKRLDCEEKGAFRIGGISFGHRLLGEGDLKLEELIDTLKAFNYQGYLSLEYHGDDADKEIVQREAKWLRSRL